MKKTLFKSAIILLTCNLQSFAQNIGINGTGAFAHPSALLDIDASPGNNTGLLIPRIPLTAINASAPITTPTISLLVYNTASASSGTNAVSPGYYYWDGIKWVRFAYTPSGNSANAWTLLGNAGTIPSTNFLGTTDAQDVVFRTNNTEKMRITSSGSVGIGTATPINDLHIEQTVDGDVGTRLWNPNSTGVNAREIMIVGQAGGGKYGYLAHHNDGYLNGTYTNLKPNTTLLSAGVGDLLLSAGTTTNDVYIGTNGMNSQHVIVKGNSGNVGIGTISPTEKLHVVNAAIKLDGNTNANSNSAVIRFGLNNSTDIGWIGDGSTTDNNMYLYSYNNDVRLGTGATSTAANSIYLDQAGNTGVGTVPAASSAKLDVVSTTAGFAMPRMTSVQRKAIVAPIDGLQVYDINLKGYYTYDGTKWDCVTAPAGTVDYFANITAPNGYLECNGQAVNRTTYAELFAAIGTLYGAGDGSTTFNIPDLRGEFIRGWDHGKGTDPTRTIGSKQAGTIVNGDFDPTYTPSSMQANSGSYQSNYGADPFDATAYSTTTTIASYYSAAGSYNQAAGPNNFGATRPRNIALMPCIKF